MGRLALPIFALAILSQCSKTDPIICDLSSHPCSCDERTLFGGTCTEYTGISQEDFKGYCADGTQSLTKTCELKSRVGTCLMTMKSDKAKKDYQHYYSPAYTATTAEAFCKTGGTIVKVISLGEMETEWLPE